MMWLAKRLESSHRARRPPCFPGGPRRLMYYTGVTSNIITLNKLKYA